MRITCIDVAACEQVLDVLQRQGITRGVSWEGGSPLDERFWVFVNAPIAPEKEAAILRDIEAIAGATVRD